MYRGWSVWLAPGLDEWETGLRVERNNQRLHSLYPLHENLTLNIRGTAINKKPFFEKGNFLRRLIKQKTRNSMCMWICGRGQTISTTTSYLWPVFFCCCCYYFLFFSFGRLDNQIGLDNYRVLAELLHLNFVHL